MTPMESIPLSQGGRRSLLGPAAAVCNALARVPRSATALQVQTASDSGPLRSKDAARPASGECAREDRASGAMRVHAGTVRRAQRTRRKNGVEGGSIPAQGQSHATRTHRLLQAQNLQDQYALSVPGATDLLASYASIASSRGRRAVLVLARQLASEQAEVVPSKTTVRRRSRT